MRRFLVISPHPDDVDFSCAGTIAKLVKEGNQVEELIVSDGSKGSHAVGFGGKKLAGLRKKEQRNAGKVLGVADVSFLSETDGEVENTRNLRKKLVVFMRQRKPDVVMCPEPFLFRFDRAGILHRDHRNTGEAVFDAVYPAVGNASFFPELLKKNLKPHNVQEFWFWGSSKPQLIIDISKTIEQKIQALFCHKSQIRDMEALELRIKEWARTMGKKKHMRYAEAFRVLKLG
ncbi:MAG: PIG-L deacetylase family protein [bacterium]|nr:PIG-L deacetylase family protein [bacterium]